MHNKAPVPHVVQSDFLKAEHRHERFRVDVARQEILHNLNEEQNVQHLDYCAKQ